MTTILSVVKKLKKRKGFLLNRFLRPSSMVLANDGRGTNVIKELASASYLILPEEVSEEERKQQEVLIKPVVLGERTEETQMKFLRRRKSFGSPRWSRNREREKTPFGQRGS